MRYVTLVARPEDGALHPLDRRLTEDEAITRRAIHRVELLEDGTCVMLAEAEGDLDRLREILEDSEYVIDFSVTGDGDRGFSYSHYETNDRIRDLMQRRRESELVLKMPVEYTADGGMRATYVGEAAAFREQMAAATPEGVRIEIEETGEYHPELGDLRGLLTDRQREVLDAAVREGYYRDPREATHADLADTLNLAPGTVGEHLRKIEHTVFDAIADGRTG